MTDLRAITLHQPWATLVALGVKTIETRSWPTKYRGRILIHAAKRTPTPGDYGDWYVNQAEIYESPPHIAPAQPETRGWPGGQPELSLLRREWGMADDGGQGLYYPLPLGAVVASAVLTDCVPVVDFRFERTDTRTRIEHIDDTLWLRVPGERPAREITAQLPFGDFAAGRWAWLLDDVKPTTERCPRCSGGHRFSAMAFPTGCPTCHGANVGAPVPMRGRQGLWIPNEQDWAA